MVLKGRIEKTISIQTWYRSSEGNQEISNFDRDPHPQVNVVKEIIQNECSKRGIDMKRIQSPALLALQEAGEHEQYITDLFCKSQLAVIHGKRVTVKPEDVRIVLHFRKEE